MPNTNTQQLPFVFTMKDGNKFTGYGESREDVLTRHIITGTRRAGHQLSREEADDPNNRYVLFDSATFEHYLGEKFDKIAEDAYHVAFPPEDGLSAELLEAQAEEEPASPESPDCGMEAGGAPGQARLSTPDHSGL